MAEDHEIDRAGGHVGVERACALRARGLTKRYGAIRALTEVDLDLHAGAVLGLLGENGAGKSTLIALASGAQRPSSGTLEVGGAEVQLNTPSDGQRLGVQVVHQEPRLANGQSVAANIFASDLTSGHSSLAPYNARVTARRARAHLESLSLEGDLPDVSELAAQLTPAQRQLVTIARALTSRPSILFLDEPNASLTHRETEKLWSLVRTMSESGVAVVVVSHRLRELYEVVQHVAVLRDGRKVGEGSTDEIPVDAAVRLMAGVRQRVKTERNVRRVQPKEILRLENVTNERVRSVSLSLNAGEVVGMAGLVGSGRSEIARAACGVDPVLAGAIYLEGRPVRFRSARGALKAGVIMTTEERRVGLFRSHDVGANATASVFDREHILGFVRRGAERKSARDVLEHLSVKGTPETPITALSGGNQQKVLIGRALAASPKVLLLDEPTHGIDVATKSEIYQIIRELADSGVAMLFISSELDELFQVADRIVVVRHGTVTADLPVTSDSASLIAAALGEVPVGVGAST